MSISIDDELRQDFVTESRELVCRLDEQLVVLEQSPDDAEQLNAVFRGFHTIKGGAGFFALPGIVDLCHVAEDIFNELRAGKLALTADIMDTVLAAVDRLRDMLDAVGLGMDPGAAPEHIVAQLRLARQGSRPAAAAAAAAAPPPVAVAAPPPAAAGDPDSISEDEFEALLRQFHGPDGPSAPSAAPAAPTAPAAVAPAETSSAPDVTPAPIARPSAGREPSAARPVAEAETSIRVDTERLDQVMNMIGELVLVRNRLKTQAGRHQGIEDLRKTLVALDVITSALQGSIMQMRMQPIRKLFARFPRLVRETARKIGKDVELETLGESTELDKTLSEALNDPLVHMVRNAIDHGIESPERRVAAGKPAKGRVRLAAEQHGDHILIMVSDDGAGIDPERIRRKAVEKGLIDASTAATLDREATLQLLFLPGFSTKDQVSELSGRGVGMDVVRSNINALSGTVSIDSELGEGSTITISLPLTLAIQTALMVRVGPRLYALPLQPVCDVFVLNRERMRRVDRWDVVLYREQPLRLLEMGLWADVSTAGHDQAEHVVVVELAGERYGLIVSHVRAREEIVVKPLGWQLRGLAGLAGATITGDGGIALLLDLPGLVAARERSGR